MFLFQSRRVTSGWTTTRTPGSELATPTPPSPPSPAPSSWTTLLIWRGRAGSPTIRRSSSRASWPPRRRWCRWAPQKRPSGKSGVANWLKIVRLINSKNRPQIFGGQNSKDLSKNSFLPLLFHMMGWEGKVIAVEYLDKIVSEKVFPLLGPT